MKSNVFILKEVELPRPKPSRKILFKKKFGAETYYVGRV
jgi:hypothetical protein